MSITTSQQIAKYYQTYQTVPVVFTKEVVGASGLITKQVFLKCLGEQWPCIIYSTSFAEAKIIVNTRGGLNEKAQKANNLVSLRFGFKAADKNDPVTFYVGAKIGGFSPYNNENKDVNFVTLSYTQRPPDDLIDILGQIIETNINSSKRREDRILVTPESSRKLGLAAKETMVYVQGVPRKCILRDVSFSGAKVIMVGIAKFLLKKEITIRIDLEDPRETITIKGTVVRSEDVEGRRDLTAIAIHYDESLVPMTYKLHINNYLGQQRKGGSDEEDDKTSPPTTPILPKNPA
jgi:hypothetical protein